MYDILQLNQKTVADLKVIAKEMGVKTPAKYKKEDLVYKILDQQAIAPSKTAPKKDTRREQQPAAKQVGREFNKDPKQVKPKEKQDTSQLSINAAEPKKEEKKISYPKKPISE